MHARPHSRKDQLSKDRLARWEQGPQGTIGIGDKSKARVILCIISTLSVLIVFFDSKILQTGILQTGPNQFVENQPVESCL